MVALRVVGLHLQQNHVLQDLVVGILAKVLPGPEKDQPHPLPVRGHEVGDHDLGGMLCPVEALGPDLLPQPGICHIGGCAWHPQ